MNKKYTFLILLTFCAYTLTAQTIDCFLEITPSNQRTTAIQQVKQTTGDAIGQLPAKHKTELSEIYISRGTTLVQQLERGDFYFDTTIYPFFQDLFQTILQANPDINQKEVRLLVSRYGYPNAYCMGEGKIAFVLCHELAHHQLNHVNTAIQERVEWINSEETAKQLEKIAKSEFNTYQQALTFLQGNIFESNRHSRLHEHEADKLALQFLKNTQFNATEALRCLEILDQVDNRRINTIIDLSKIFDTPEYPFKDFWLEEEEAIFSNVKKSEAWNVDSLKTHPDCLQRINALKPFLQDYKLPDTSLNAFFKNTFQQLSNQSDFEPIQNEFLFQNLGRSLFNTLLLLQKHPNRACLHAMVGHNLYNIHEAQKNRELYNVLEKPALHQASDYKIFLTFLQHLRMKELAKINYHYLKNRESLFIENQGFHHALLLATELVGKTEEYQKLNTLYTKKYSQK